MTWLQNPPLSTVFRRRENDGEPVNDRRLKSRIAAGHVVRIAPGAYADADAWASLDPLERHAQSVWEAGYRMRAGQVFCLHSAAALHGIDILGAWPAFIDTFVQPRGGGRSTGRIRRHDRDLSAVGVVPWADHFVTTPLQTTADLIASMRFLDGVVVADRALWARRRDGPLVTASDLSTSADARVGAGSARARRAAAFATPLSDSVRESQSRVVISGLGFPEPELQARFVLDEGGEAFTDFYWPEQRHIGEFDGVGKYIDPALLRGRTPEQALIAEKDREDQLRRQVRAFSRWRTPALTSPRLLYDILTGAGLPTHRRRPGR